VACGDCEQYDDYERLSMPRAHRTQLKPPPENRMRLSRFRRAAVLALTAVALVGTSGCFGSFNLTRKLYGWNKGVSDEKFVRELVFLGLNVVPVYSIAGLIDVIVTNSIEFWTGKNPVDMSGTIRVDSTTKVRKVAVAKDGLRIMTLETFRLDKLVATTTVQYVTGAPYMTFETVLADGRTETHVAAIGVDGKAFVRSGTYAELVRAGVVTAGY
jgi:hypothetical protein